MIVIKKSGELSSLSRYALNLIAPELPPLRGYLFVRKESHEKSIRETLNFFGIKFKDSGNHIQIEYTEALYRLIRKYLFQ